MLSSNFGVLLSGAWATLAFLIVICILKKKIDYTLLANMKIYKSECFVQFSIK